MYGYETLKQKLHYLYDNPLRAVIVYETSHNKYSSAIDYCTTYKGIIELELVLVPPDQVLVFLFHLSVLRNFQ
jgi:hypothetical protein